MKAERFAEFCLSVVLCTFIALNSHPAHAARQKAARTVSVDLGYIPHLSANKSMHNLWLEYEYLGTAVFDWIGGDGILGSNFLTRLIWAAGFGYGWYWANYPWYVANHEYGHGARISAQGSVPYFIWNGSSVRHPEILSFILEGYGHPGGGASTGGSGGGVGGLPTDWNTNVSAGGMNNSMMFAEALQDEAFYNTGHINHVWSYFRVMQDARNYAGATNNGFSGDLSTLIADWNNKGFGITTSDVSQGDTISFFGSFTTLAYAWSFARYVAIGDPNVDSFRLGAFKLPDISFFANRNGISYRLRTALDFRTVAFPISVEYMVKGRQTVEVSFGVRHSAQYRDIRKLGSLVQGYVSTAGGGGLRFVKDFVTGSSSFFSLGAGLFTVNSLEGERTATKMVSGIFGLEAWGRLSWRY